MAGVHLDRAQGVVVASLLPRVRDLRRMGAGALDLCAVAAGRVDGYYEQGLSPWDMSAGLLVATEAGARVGGLRGVPHPAAERSFPNQTGKALREAVAGAEVRLTARGGKGLTAAEMLDILRDELASRPYQLVIWQTGTVEAVRNLPPGEFAATLSEGAALAQDAQADLVLVDPQFSRFLQTNTNLDPYAQAFQQVAAMPGVALFRRYDLMRAWVNEGRIDLERAPRADRQRTIEALHRCLGLHLARLILGAGRS